jgi:hypothetical protein
MDLPAKYKKLTRSEKRLVRLEYIKRQDNKCWFCGKDLNKQPPKLKTIDRELFPKKFFDSPIHLQHDHKTGLIEGAVHAYCNAVLWQYHGK